MPDNATTDGKDLWGRAFLQTPVESAPLALLKEQADALTRRTDGRIVGEVLREVSGGRSGLRSTRECPRCKTISTSCSRSPTRL
jgi:hypothetical protein